MSATARFTLAELERLPAVCSMRELVLIFGISSSRGYELEAQGAFDLFKLKPGIGPKRYSGVLLRRYLDGDPVYQPTFGPRRPRHESPVGVK